MFAPVTIGIPLSLALAGQLGFQTVCPSGAQGPLTMSHSNEQHLQSPGNTGHLPLTPAMLPVNRHSRLETQENSGTVPSTPHETPARVAANPRLHTEHAAASARWQQIHDAYLRIKKRDPDLRLSACAAELGVPLKSLWNIVHKYAPRGFASERHQSGRRPGYLPSEQELACVREIYTRLDDSEARGRGLGSSRIAAFRLAAKSDDPRIGEQFKGVVLKPRKSKTVPPSWMRLLDTPASVLDAHRDKRSTMASYISTPRHRTLITADGEEIPLHCGAIFETDDGTLNFYAHIPWPFGGDKSSDKYGVRLGRWQFLPVVDVHSEMCLAFDVVARNAGSYRGEDSRAIIGRTMFEVAVPELWRLERGSWESQIVRDALKLSNVPVFNAWQSKQKSAIERFFDRVWTPASLIPGHVGRDRDRYKEVTNLALACQDGRRDARDHFLALDQLLPKLIKCVEFANTEPIVSKSGWGQWVPRERWADAAAQQRKLDPAFAVFFSREQRVWTVRGGAVGGSVDCPQIKFPIWFQCGQLWEFEGCKVRAFFDPYHEPTLGTIVLEDDSWRSYKRGHVIARGVPALDLPPQAVLADGWDGHARGALAVRKAIAKAVRTESWNWLGGRSSRASDGLGNEVSRETRASSAGPASPKRIRIELSRQTAPRRATDSYAALFGG